MNGPLTRSAYELGAKIENAIKAPLKALTILLVAASLLAVPAAAMTYLYMMWYK